MNLNELIKELDNTESYDLENVLIDIYVIIEENKADLSEAETVFTELSFLRDVVLSNGAASYFEDWGKHELEVSTIEKYVDKSICEVVKMLNSKRFEAVDDWTVKNEWFFNDELSKLVKEYLG